jgi:hypothetical protein
MNPFSSAEVLIAKVKERYALSLGQLAEILNVPIGTIYVAATGRRTLPPQKIELLQKLLTAVQSSTARRAPVNSAFPGYVTELLKKELAQLNSKRSKTALKIIQMEQAYERISGARAHLQLRHDELQEAQVPVRVMRTLKRHALLQDVRIDRVDQHHIVKLRAVMAGLDAEIKVIQAALTKKSL